MLQDEGKKKKKQTPASDDGAENRINDLHDDLLLHILSFLPDARDLVRTAAVSRRWRYLWTRVPVLKFDNTNFRLQSQRMVDETRFLDFIHAALARRANPIDQLTLRLFRWKGPDVSRLNLWLDWAMHHAVKFLDVDVCLPWDNRIEARETRVYMHGHHLLLPDHSRATKISLGLDNVVLKLPSTVTFHELTHLSLSYVSFLDDDHLCRLLSSPSCFPRLQKLRLVDMRIEKLQLKCSTLEFLELDNLYELMHVDIDTPRLSVLTIDTFMPSQDFSFRAPALKKLKCVIEFGYGQFSNTNTILLIQRCTFVERYTMSLHLPLGVDVKAVADDVKAYLPQLPHVKDVNLTLGSSGRTHNFVAAAARVMARCNNLQYLRLHIPGQSIYVIDKERSSCNIPERWMEDDDDMIVSLKHLREVELRGFFGRNCHDMAQLLLAVAPALQRMIVSTLSEKSDDDKEEEDDDDDGAPPLRIPICESSLPRCRGEWTAANAYQYEWTPAGVDLQLIN